MTLSDKNEAPEAPDSFGGASAADSEGARCDPKPFQALKRAVRRLFERACRLPGGGADLFGDAGRAEDESEHSSAFETLSRHVRAAQRAGEVRAGDVSLMTTLIACAVIGAADLAQYPRPTAGAGASDADALPRLLLELLATTAGD
jgi:hypothetical protein